MEGDLTGSTLGLGIGHWPSRPGPEAGGMEGRWRRSPAIAVLDTDVAAPVELLAVLEPAVGRLGVPRRRLTLQRLLLTHLSCLALHLLQLGPRGCGVQGREVSVGVVGTVPGRSRKSPHLEAGTGETGRHPSWHFSLVPTQPAFRVCSGNQVLLLLGPSLALGWYQELHIRL